MRLRGERGPLVQPCPPPHHEGPGVGNLPLPDPDHCTTVSGGGGVLHRGICWVAGGSGIHSTKDRESLQGLAPPAEQTCPCTRVVGQLRPTASLHSLPPPPRTHLLALSFAGKASWPQLWSREGLHLHLPVVFSPMQKFLTTDAGNFSGCGPASSPARSEEGRERYGGLSGQLPRRGLGGRAGAAASHHIPSPGQGGGSTQQQQQLPAGLFPGGLWGDELQAPHSRSLCQAASFLHWGGGGFRPSPD